MAQEAVVINMGEIMPEATVPSAPKKAAGALFGPNIGIVARGPEWTERDEKTIDELTPDIVRNWWSKSKQNQATTTLQALVNLKRPSLRLVPLEVSDSDDPNHADSLHHHGLEFEYDCDAPKCSITVHIVVSPNHRFADKGSGSSNSKILVYETTTDGGFGKVLKLEEGATLELGKFELQPHVPSQSNEGKAEKAEISTSELAGPPELPSGPQAAEERQERKSRLLNFHLRRRQQERNVAGPAIAVLDSDANNKDEDRSDKKEDEENLGVRAMIRLSALDSNGKPLPCINEQTTYLHILRFGAPPPVDEEDKRPWVVKVVKREATIGAHTFQLHEIYGLSSTTSSAPHPTQPPPTTYPPQPATPAYEEEPSSECLLCLSSPREVVLLPCRHLVACRDCALNMIEFGAGGQIQQPTETSDTNAVEGENAETPQGEGTTPADATTPAAPATPATTVPLMTPAARRKRKAKGWFCPVCRQPYTACLRITTTPPAKEGDDTDEQESVDIGDHPLAGPPIPEPPPAAEVAPRAGGLASLVRPGFLRSISRQQVPDPERGQATSAA